MKTLELLSKIQTHWIAYCVSSISSSNDLGDNIQVEIEKLVFAIQQILEVEDYSIFESLLEQWGESLTKSDIENGSPELTSFLNMLFLNLSQFIAANLPAEDAVLLSTEIVKVFSFAYQEAAQIEVRIGKASLQTRLNEFQRNIEILEISKTNFTAIAAHELKTPLTLVEGYSSMLKDDLSDLINEEKYMILFSGLDKGIQRLKSIIHDLIDVSLIDNNLLKLNLQPVWLSQILKALYFELENSFTSRSITLTIEEHPAFIQPITSDPERLSQAFRNILVNAIKFTPDNGKIEVSGNELPGFIEIRFSDTGIGISPENQTRIFDKFSQVGHNSLHSSGKTKFKGGGPGLGLSISKGIIEALGGTIWVESKGHDEQTCPGSTFHVILPDQIDNSNEIIASLINSLSTQYQETNKTNG